MNTSTTGAALLGVALTLATVGCSGFVGPGLDPATDAPAVNGSENDTGDAGGLASEAGPDVSEAPDGGPRVVVAFLSACALPGACSGTCDGHPVTAMVCLGRCFGTCSQPHRCDYGCEQLGASGMGGRCGGTCYGYCLAPDRQSLVAMIDGGSCAAPWICAGGCAGPADGCSMDCWAEGTRCISGMIDNSLHPCVSLGR